MTTRENPNLNELAKIVHNNNAKWWHDLDTGAPIERNKGELLMLVITELAEAVEGVRKNLMDDKLPHRKMEEVEMADAYIRLLDFAGGFNLTLHWISTEETEQDLKLSDNKAESVFQICGILIMSRLNWGGDDFGVGVSAILASIRLYCHKFGHDLDGAVNEKRAYNLTREDHRHEHRKTANGKKF